MTKEEVRTITMAKARLAPGQIIWDVGSGTGSLAVEAALLVPDGTVFAIERNNRAVELIKVNSSLFGTANITVVQGEAPEALRNLPDPDRVLIGGSGGKLSAIADMIAPRLLPGGRVVINAVTLETLSQALEYFHPPWEMEIIQVSVTRTRAAGKSNLMNGLNPVFIIAASKGGQSNGG
jgi:precorrin-6Y C5,15-methyltransferase (decarboxylating) CbiT subunit